MEVESKLVLDLEIEPFCRGSTTAVKGTISLEPGAKLVDLLAQLDGQLPDLATALKLLTRFLVGDPDAPAHPEADDFMD